MGSTLLLYSTFSVEVGSLGISFPSCLSLRQMIDKRNKGTCQRPKYMKTLSDRENRQNFCSAVNFCIAGIKERIDSLIWLRKDQTAKLTS